jgi:hypothetical protein
MITLKQDTLLFSFPDVHESASLRVDFQRTLRIPDDGKKYPLPPGLGRFPIRHVDDYAPRVPESWLTHGGVMLPMYQSEALWLHFGSSYPFAVKVATGKINAVSGKTWTDGLHRKPQDYVVVPRQPWLDGYNVGRGVIRQFVAMPLGAGYTVEEQVTGEAEAGGLQLIVYPMTRESYERYAKTMDARPVTLGIPRKARKASGGAAMGLAPGGRMRQEIYKDRYDFSDWNHDRSSRCFVHMANSLAWGSIAGEPPPHAPVTAAAYKRAKLPWFEFYGDGETVPASSVFKKVKSVVGLAAEKGDMPLPENESVEIPDEEIVHLRRNLRPDQVREGQF